MALTALFALGVVAPSEVTGAQEPPEVAADAVPAEPPAAPAWAAERSAGATAPTTSAAAAQAELSMQLPTQELAVPPEPYGVVAPWECSPELRPGTRAFGDLLRQASGGRYVYEDVRPCGASWGITYSQHKTGRAVDFMVDSRDPRGRADGLAVLQWLFEPLDGVPHARLRRLGVVEIIWDGRIWTTAADTSILDPDPGAWRPYDGLGCSGDPVSEGTQCHYDHFHFTLSAAGAAGLVTAYLPPGSTGTPPA